MDTFDIEVFLKIVKLKNFSRAASSLSITQSTLSQRTQRLESELGFPLFTRHKGRHQVELTPLGKQFLNTAVQIQNLWEGAKQLGCSEVQQTLRLSVVESVLLCTLPTLVSSFTEQHSDIRVTISTFYSAEAYEQLEKQTIDVAIVGLFREYPDLLVTPLFSEPWVLVAGDATDFPPTVHPTMLDPDKQIRLLRDATSKKWENIWFVGCADPQINGRTISFLTNEHSFRPDTWAIVPVSVANYLARHNDIRIHKIDPAPPSRILYMVHRSNLQTDTLQELKQCIFDCLPDTSGIIPLR